MHYANGREAKVGDLVVGYAYNTIVRATPVSEPSEMKKLVGTLVKAVPDSATCNAEIEWVESCPLLGMSFDRPRMAQGEPRIYITPQGEIRGHFVCRDYTHVGALLHVEDAIWLLADGSALRPVVASPPAPLMSIDTDSGKVSVLPETAVQP